MQTVSSILRGVSILVVLLALAAPATAQVAAKGDVFLAPAMCSDPAPIIALGEAAERGKSAVSDAMQTARERGICTILRDESGAVTPRPAVLLVQVSRRFCKPSGNCFAVWLAADLESGARFYIDAPSGHERAA